MKVLFVGSKRYYGRQLWIVHDYNLICEGLELRQGVVLGYVMHVVSFVQVQTRSQSLSIQWREYLNVSLVQ